MKTRIMYLENKSAGAVGQVGLIGPARIGRVTYSRSGRSLTYGGLTFHRSEGFKSNYVEAESGDAYWISGPRRDGADRLYGERRPVEIDEDVRVEYWTEIRGRPELVARATS